MVEGVAMRERGIGFKNHDGGARSAILVSIREGRGDCSHHLRDENNK
jgi:hypothetical protein